MRYLFKLLLTILYLTAPIALEVSVSQIQYSEALAQSSSRRLKKAQKYFERGNIPAAEKALRANVKKGARVRKSIKVESLKLYGVCQYLLGKRKSARASFKAALKLNPKSILKRQYILDPQIASVFSNIRSALKKKKKKSGFIVRTNAKKAIVYVDNVYRGKAGKLIQLKRGRYTIKVAARGYRPRVEKLKIGSDIRKVKLKLTRKKKSSKKRRSRRRDRDLAYDEDLPTGSRSIDEAVGEGFNSPPKRRAPQRRPRERRPPQSYPPPRQGYPPPQGVPPQQPPPQSTGSSLIAALPLGAGQFQNGDYFKAILFAGAQIGGVAFAFYNIQLEQGWVDYQAAPDPNGPTLEDAIVAQDEARMGQYIGWGITLAAYGLGVFEAFYTMGERAGPAPPPRQAPRPYYTGYLDPFKKNFGMSLAIDF